MSENEWMTPREVAERWQVTQQTLLNWRRKKWGPVAKRFGHQWRYRRRDVEAFEKVGMS